MRYKKSNLTTHKNSYIVPDDYWNEHSYLKNCAFQLQKIKLDLIKENFAPKDIDRVILSDVMLAILKIFAESNKSHKIALDEGQKIVNELKKPIADNLDIASRSIKTLLAQYELRDTNSDFLGFLYQLLQDQHGRKSDGQFYTPGSVVKQILTQVKIDPKRDKLIMDPACGSGQFLLETFNQIDHLYQKEHRPLSKVERYSKILSSLLGADIDDIACLIARFNLLKRSEFLCPIAPVIICTNTLKKSMDLFDSNLLQKYEGKVDVVVGNPPWGAKLTAEEKKYFQKNYKIGHVGLNTFTLFIERSLDFLKPKEGRLGFLIPEAYLKIKNHQLSRQQVLGKSKIIFLQVCGDVFKKVYAPALIIVVETNDDKGQRVSNSIITSKSLSGDSGQVLIPQSAFYSTHENIFNINHSDESNKIKNKLREQEVKYLEDNALFFLGIVTGNNNKYLSKTNGDPRQNKILVGKDVNKFKVNFSGHYFIYDKDELQQVAPKNYYLEPYKLLYKFISSKLIFAYDDQSHFMLNNINGVIPKISGMNPRYIVALLNSKLLQYYYSSTFFTVKVLRGNLEKLPLKIAPLEQQLELERIVLEAESEKDDKILNRYENQINESVYDLYGLSGKEIDFVERELSSGLL